MFHAMLLEAWNMWMIILQEAQRAPWKPKKKKKTWKCVKDTASAELFKKYFKAFA